MSRPPSLPPAGDILGVTFPWWGVVYYPWSDVPPPPLPPAPPSGLGRRRALSTFVLGARRGPPPLPPPPCALSGAAWVPRLRPLQARLAQLRPRSSTTPSPFDLCSWSRCPSCTGAAATAASMLHRYVGAKGPLLSSRLGDQRRRAAPQLGISTPKSRSALRSYRSVRWNVGGPSAFPWYKGLSGWRKPSLWVLQRRFLRMQKQGAVRSSSLSLLQP